MTTKAKKQSERRYAERLLNGMIGYISLDEGPERGERPDYFVRLHNPPDIGLEVTELMIVCRERVPSD